MGATDFKYTTADSALAIGGTEKAVFLAPVLTAIRASGFGSAFGVATLLIGSCSVLPNETDTLRVKRVEEAILPMARIALEAEQAETAKRLYLRLLDVDPGSVMARMGLGDIAVARRDSREAARWYAAAVALSPRGEERHAALLAHGRAALAGGELDAARKSFARLTSAREDAPSESVAWGLNGLGLVALLEGDIRAAIRLMERAVLLVPEEPMLSDNLSRALDLSAGMAPEAAVADPMRDMVAAPDPATPLVGRNPARSAEAPPVEEDFVEYRNREEPIRAREIEEEQTRVDPTREPRRRRPGAEVSGTDVGPTDRSELRPYAIKVGGEYYVRIGAYDMPSEARAVASELGGVTAELVDVVEFGMGDGRNAVRLYRVLVGPIASSARLIELLAALDDLGYGSPRVPPSVAHESERATVPDPAPSKGRRAAGPELVEVSLETVGGDAAADRTSARTAVATPEPEAASADATSGVDAAASGIESEGAFADAPDVAADAASEESGPSPSVVGPGGIALENESAPASRPDDRLPDAPSAERAPSDAPDAAPDTAVEESGASSGAGGIASPDAAPESGTVAASRADDELPDAPSAESGGRAPSPLDADSEAGARVVDSSPAAPVLDGIEDPADAPQFLQVGAYTVRSTAEALAAEVGGVARAPVRVVEAELPNGETMYRVQVGPIGSREAMAQLGDKLISGGYGTVRVLSGPAAADGAEDVSPAAPPTLSRPQHRVRAFMVREGAGRFLQMGAYAVRSTADTLASQLRLATSERVFVDAAPNDDGVPFYRVRIGPVASDASLAALLAALRSGYGAGWHLPSVETDARKTAFVVHEDSGRFLQMGAYAARSTANALVSELRGQVEGEVRITQASRGGGPVYRIRIGPIASDASLSALIEAVESLGYIVD